MKKAWLKWLILALVMTLLAAGIWRTLAARKAQQQALEAQQAAQKTSVAITLSATDLVQVKRLELAQAVAISGALKAANSAFVKARVPGELQELTVREGDFVKVGQIIARVEATEFQARVRQAQQQAQAAKAQVDIAQRSFDNNRSLVDQGFISKTALEASEASLAAARANYQAAQSGADVATKSLDDTVLRAPLSGQIAQRLAQPGERVSVDARVLEIVDLSRLELEANLSAADSLGVKLGQTALLTIEGASQPIKAKVLRMNPSAMAGSRSVLAYLALDNNPGLRQGLFAQGLLQTGSASALALPLSAVRTDKPQAYVQVLDKEQVRHQTVELGARGQAMDQTMVEVKGLAEGLIVLAGSVGAVREGTPVKLVTAAK